jgi:hypothetical protein
MGEGGRERERYKINYGAHLNFHEGEYVDAGEVVAHWDPYTSPILTDVDGTVKFGDILESITMQERLDPVTGRSTKVTVESKNQDLRPRISIKETGLQQDRQAAQRPGRRALPFAGGRHHHGAGRRRGQAPATCWPASPAKPPRPRTSPAVCPGWPSCSRLASPRRPRLSPRSTGMVELRQADQGQAQSRRHGPDVGEPGNT